MKYSILCSFWALCCFATTVLAQRTLVVHDPAVVEQFGRAATAEPVPQNRKRRRI